MGEQQNNKVQYLATFSVSLALLSMGLAVSWPTLVIPQLMNNQTNIVITNDEIAVMTSMAGVGVMAGSVVTRYVADSFGRRTAVLATAGPMVIGMIFLAFTEIVWVLYLGRFIMGVGKGMIMTGVMLYTGEIADKNIRGSLYVYTRVMFNLGTLLMFVFGPLVTFNQLNYALLAFPVVYFCACLWIPESPYYCLKDGKVDSARKELMRLKGAKAKTVEDELNIMQQNVKRDMESSSSVRELFTGRQYRKAVIITIGLKIVQIMSGVLSIQHYLGYIVQESHADISLTVAFIVFGAVRFVVGIMSSYLIDRVGRRPLLIYSYLGTAICFSAIAIYFIMKEVIKLDSETLRPYSSIPFVGILASTVIGTLGYQSITNIPAEIFPMNVKAIALTANMMLAGITGFIVSASFQKVVDYSGFSGVFIFFAMVAYAGAAFVFFVVPETKGLSFDEIQVILQGESYKCEEAVQLNNIDVSETIVKLNDKDEALDCLVSGNSEKDVPVSEKL